MGELCNPKQPILKKKKWFNKFSGITNWSCTHTSSVSTGNYDTIISQWPFTSYQVCVSLGCKITASTLFHDSEELVVRREHGKVNNGRSQSTAGQTACVWGSEGISAGLVITAPSLGVCASVFLPLSILLSWQEVVRDTRSVEESNELPPEGTGWEGTRARRYGVCVCVQCVVNVY